MVNTRQHNPGGEITSDMPDGNVATGVLDPPSKPGGMSDKSAMDNDSDLEPLVPRRQTRRSWRNCNRYPSRYSIERASRPPMRSCRLRIVAADSDDDSDLQYNDDDDDEPLYARKPRRNYSRAPRHISRRTVAAQQEAPDNYQQQNGVKEEDDDDEMDGGEPGIRRSTRQKKLLYGSFNQSWILGSRSLRGYPDVYGLDRDPERDPGHTSNSNEAAALDPSQSTENTEEAKPKELPAIGEEDMYTKVKRTRQTRIQYTPEPELRRLRPRLRRDRPRVAVADSEETESESAASSDEGGRMGRGQRRRVYHLRQNKPIVERFQITNNEPTRRSSRHVLGGRSFSTRPYHNQRKRRDSTSDEERFQRKKTLSLAKARSRCMPLNYKATDASSLQKTPTHSSKLTGASGPKGPADVDPMTIDTSVMFEKVGGLEGHLRCLKEMVVFPMLYREVFEQYNVQPPKGILFHGPPGTGKTLIARALANECSQGERKVSFFMRKGADCLSKWVGESERQLRLLFEQAHQMKPSIIFFDEIDGLAPVRSSKQDQIHASIVSTLLALLDGLDDRGDIIVIGATNRIDAIDPALRRPGRFDRELFFPLPGKKERVEILKIHTKPWSCPPAPELISNLAERSVGYCGADLRLLCSEAVVGAMRRRYPQIYKSSKKLLLQPDQVKVVDKDFIEAQSKIVPASCRVAACPRARLSPVVAPLLTQLFQQALNSLKRIFPHAGMASVHERITQGVYKPRFLVYASDGHFGQTSHIAPALLDAMEHIPVHMLGLDTLLDTTNRSSEEAVIQIIREASRNPPSVLYLPAVDTWWGLLPPTTHHLLLDRVAQIASDASVLVFATAHSNYQDLDPQIRSLFAYDHVEITAPTFKDRGDFWRPLLLEETRKMPPIPPIPEDELEELPLAPSPEPPPSSAAQLEELHNAEEQRLRELRLFLRDICAKLARNRQFFLFSKPVDTKEVPDYLKIIKRPMDLETVMSNIDLHLYNCAQEFLADIDLIVTNALEYNPARASEDKMIRHRAYMLKDTAYTLIKAEMDTDFEEECRKITKRRKEAKEKEEKTEAINKDDDSEILCNGVDSEIHSVSPESSKRQKLVSQAAAAAATSAVPVKPVLAALSSERTRRRKCSWAKGMISARRKNKVKTEEMEVTGETPSAGAQENSVDGSSKRTVSPLERETKKPRCSDETDGPKTESLPTGEEGTPKKRPRKNSTRKLVLSDQAVTNDDELLSTLLMTMTSASANWSVDKLLDCRARMFRVIETYADRYDRQQLATDLEDEFKSFAKIDMPS